ncbi:MAG: hypothetical protein NVS9B12_11000 [Vulcanimicrobiaceae bacterium]
MIFMPGPITHAARLTRRGPGDYNGSGFAGPLGRQNGRSNGALVYVMAFSNTTDIGGLLAGGRQTLRLEKSVRLEPFEGWTFPAPAQVALEIHGIEQLLEVVGAIDVEAIGACGRCLEEVRSQMHLDVNEELEPKAALKDDPFSESNVLSGDRLDVADLIRQLVLSAAPFAVLCDPECRGLCANCGSNKNQGACTCLPELE